MPKDQSERLSVVENRLLAHHEAMRLEFKQHFVANGKDEASAIPLDRLMPPSLKNGKLSKPAELYVDLSRGEVDALKLELRDIVHELSRKEWNPEKVQKFLEKAHAMNPSFLPSLDTRDPFEMIHSAAMAFNHHLCLPSGTVFFPARFGNQIAPEFWDGEVLDTTWREFPAPMGESAFCVVVDWKEGGSPGHAVEKFIFIDPRQLYIDATTSHEQITKSPGNAFEVEVQPHVRSLTKEEYTAIMEGERMLFEEVEHAHDRSYMKLFRNMHPTAQEMDVGVEALLAPTARELRILWGQLRLDGIRSPTLFSGITELSGQIGGTIRQMELLIREGENDRAFHAFCNHAAHLEAHREIVRSQGGGVDFTNPYSGYAICGHRSLKDITLPDNSDAGILQACKQPGRHPAEHALDLLKSSYAKNIRSLSERQALLQTKA
jgi:hypothetical protein